MVRVAGLISSCVVLAWSVSGFAQGPVNLDDAKKAVVAYHDSGRWDRDSERVVHRAERWIDIRAKRGGKLAMVLDIDETSLLNWKEEKATDFGYVPQLWDAYEASGTADGSPEILELFRHAQAHGVSVFFITGRREKSRAGTAKNLANAGYSPYVQLVMRPTGDHRKSVVPFKSGARAAIEKKGYDIIVNVGDQLSDLRGGHSERSYKLPNPMYFIP
jgi:predicted secreted acid phosphatase